MTSKKQRPVKLDPNRVLDEFLQGKKISSFGPDGEKVLRHAVKEYMSHATRMMFTMDAMRDLIAWTQHNVASLGQQLFGEWNEDPVIRSALVGEGYAYQKFASMLANIINAETGARHG